MALRQTLKQYLYFSGFSLTIASDLGLMAMVPSIGTLYLLRMSIPGMSASERDGPTSITWTFFSVIIFSRPRSASDTGTPGEASRRSRLSIFIGRFVSPTFTPPLALISATASSTALRHSLPSINVTEVGTPIRIGSCAELGIAQITAQDRKSTRLNSSHGYISYA